MTCRLPRPWIFLVLLGAVSVAAAPNDGWDPWRQGPAKSASQGPVPEAAAQLPRTFARVFADGSAAMQSARLAGRLAPPALSPVVLMADFADSCFYGREQFYPDGIPTSRQSEFYYAAHDSVYYDHLLTDVRDFYAAASGGRFALNFTLRAEVPLLDQPMGYYGNHPEQGEQPVILARDVIAAHDAAVDFSAFDTVFLIHPGAGEETDVLNDSPEQIYSTYLGPEDFQQAYEDSLIDQPYLPTDDFPEGEGVRHVLILPENEFQDSFEGFSGFYGSLGVYCFEVGLRLGMLSLTDFTPSGSPDSQGIGQFGLMGYGLFSAGGFVPPQPCAFNKQLMGWLDPYPVDANLAATWTLQPSEFPEMPQAAARVDLTGAEYYLLEYRLQDPDGNRIFSFTGDLNGNNVPDFYDADSANGDGTPTGFFDPDEDTREWFAGAEWDFFLSDNTAREPEVKGAGSGIYVWHIDEGVIREAFGARRNLFNANPDRKSVDLEEADGIQDLDSRQPTPWWLGGDFDSFRGEDADAFGPDTRPDTRTNGGVPTGLALDQISNVVVDSTHVFDPGTDAQYTGILYAETMSFRCRREAVADVALQARAALDLPGVDMTGAHLLAVASAGAADSDPVLVAAADSGRVYALTFDLAEWTDHDGDPATVQPLAVGVDPDGAFASWLQPAAAGQFDGDDLAPEIVLAAADGLYAFRLDGTPLATGPGAAVGRLAAFTVVTPPVLLPADSDIGFGAPRIACIGTEEPGASAVLRFLDDQGQDFAPPVDLGGHAVAAPTLNAPWLYVPLIGTAGEGRLVAVSWIPAAAPQIAWSVELDLIPVAEPCTAAGATILVRDGEGRVQSVTVVAGQPRVDSPWPAELRSLSPFGAGGACLGDGILGRVSTTGVWQTGWPVRPFPALQPTGCQPLALDLGSPHHLFATRDGRLYLADRDGLLTPGWPAAAPADLAATPVVVRRSFENADGILLAVAATTPAVAGVEIEDEILETRAVARLRSWILPDADNDAVGPAGAMYGGGPERGGGIGDLAETPAVGRANLAAHHVCYPQPLTTADLRVRGWIPAAGTARAVILNLQGEKVRDTGTVPVAGGQVFELEIDMNGVASGLYVCTLQAGGETSVRSIAVAR